MLAKFSAATLLPSKAISEHMHVLEMFTHLIAVAGSTVDATQKICAMAAAFAPEAEANKLHSDITAGGLESEVLNMQHDVEVIGTDFDVMLVLVVAGIQSIEEVLRSKQESHVKHFLQTEAASRAGHVAEEQTSTLRSNVQG